jgi:hypothetical protein
MLHAGSLSALGRRAAPRPLRTKPVKNCGLEPRAYLREATLRAARNLGTVILARDLKSSES